MHKPLNITCGIKYATCDMQHACSYIQPIFLSENIYSASGVYLQCGGLSDSAVFVMDFSTNKLNFRGPFSN